jgi:hypothetical protein
MILKYCNCAGCDREILGDSFRGVPGLENEPKVAGRIFGRPYCSLCLSVQRPSSSGKCSTRDNGPDPWYENAVRELEG